MISRTRKTVEEVVREQFDAFERRERLLTIEERRERAARLKLPVDYPRTTMLTGTIVPVNVPPAPRPKGDLGDTPARLIRRRRPLSVELLLSK
jgi:hypothetical protein